MNEINIAEIFIANLIGAFLMIGVLMLYRWNLNRDRQHVLLFVMCCTILADCIVDPCVFAVDGKSGFLCWTVVYVGNLFLFLSNLIISPCLLMMIDKHINGKETKAVKIFICTIVAIGIIGLIVNIFYPFVFSVDENSVYSRGDFFWSYNIIGIIFFVTGGLMYMKGRITGGFLKFFPVVYFFIPAIICMIIQSTFYGVSVIYTGMAVGVSLMVFSLQNEQVFTDSLTGVFSRSYFESLQEKLEEANGFALVMVNMNNFRLINEKLGHSTGDKALIRMASILQQAAGSRGSVVRYCGDEFIVLLRSDDQSAVDDCCEKIKAGINTFNSRRVNRYKISASMSSGVFNLDVMDWDEIFEIIDVRMSEEKNKAHAKTLEQTT